MQPPRFKTPKAPAVSVADAESAAALALSFIAEDAQRLVRFMSETGLSPNDLRENIGSRGILLAVLEHLLADETLLLTFTANHGLRPETIGRFQALLQGNGDRHDEY